MERIPLFALAFLVFSLLDNSPANAADQYLCIVDQATGFKFENGRWNSTNFKVEGERYIFKEIPPRKSFSGDKTYTFELKKFGSRYVRADCEAEKKIRLSHCLSQPGPRYRDEYRDHALSNIL